jgi:hypothetical protein
MTGVTEEKARYHQFHEGEFLSADDAARVVRAAPARIVVVAGMAESGKTTLVAGLYELFHKGAFADYRFAGSRTLPGFERRCHLARLTSGRQSPHTERTRHSEDHQLLHLRLAERDKPQHHDLLFTDIYGEAFRRAADSSDECRKLLILKRADHLAILIDGKKAVSKTERQTAFSAPESLLRQCLDSGMLDRSAVAQLVVTKWDIVARASAQDLSFVQGKTTGLIEKYGNRLAVLSSHRIAVRPSTPGATGAGDGVAQLLRTWVGVIRQNPLAAAAPGYGEFHTEFDRMVSWWPISPVGGRGADA